MQWLRARLGPRGAAGLRRVRLTPLVASRRGRSLLAVVAAMVVGLVALAAVGLADSAGGCDFSPANNGTPGCSQPLPGTNFAGGDGNLMTSPTTFGTSDWQDISPNEGIDLPSGTGDNSFGQGSKEDNPSVSTVSGSIPPNKSDLSRFFESSQSVNIGGTVNNFLYLAWERTNVLGSANMDFEINQAATAGLGNPGPHTIVRTAGDLLVTFDFTNGGGTPTLGLLRWVTSGPTSQCFSSNTLPCWGNHLTLNGTDSIGAVNNLDSVTDPIGTGAPRILPALTFGETAINLTAAGVFPPGTCEGFGSVFVKSRSSASFGAELKDFIAPVPVNISNCGSIRIIKQSDPRGQDKVFSFTSNLPAQPAGTVGTIDQGGVACPGNSSAGVQADGSFCLNDTGNTGATQGSNDPAQNSAGNTVYNNALQAGTYTVTEGAEPGGFTFEDLSCSGNNTTTTNGKAATIMLAPGDSVVCRYTNQLNTATLGTQVSNAGPVFPSAPVHDTATVTGNQAADTPSGTVTFFLCGPIPTGACSSGGTNIGTGTLSGSGASASANSPDVNTAASPLTPGRYCFRAEWPGDSNYPGNVIEFGGANGTNECFSVRTIPTTTTTTPSPGSNGTTPFASMVSDHAIVQATLAGDGTPTGTVTFFVCDPTQTSGGACPAPNGTQVGSAVTTQAISGSSPPASSADSAMVTVNKTGTWCFRAVYTPGGANGSNYTGSSDASSTECFTVNDSTLSTSAQTWLPNDTAVVTPANGAPLNGTLSAQLYTGGTCASGSEVSGQLYSKTLTNATSAADRTLTTNNTTFSVTTSTSVSWQVTFTSTDSNVTPSSHCESTSLTINN
jgi:hypothetical protein